MARKKKNFVRRVWLNPPDHPSSGSVVCFDGFPAWSQDEPKTIAFLEVSDCHSKIRLHQSDLDTKAVFTEKVKKLRDTLNEFLAHLEKVSDAVWDDSPVLQDQSSVLRNWCSWLVDKQEHHKRINMWFTLFLGRSCLDVKSWWVNRYRLSNNNSKTIRRVYFLDDLC